MTQSLAAKSACPNCRRPYHVYGASLQILAPDVRTFTHSGVL